MATWPQPNRTETLERFKRGEIRLLVASDVAARGLDIKGMSHVFNFDVPIHAEDYVHRIGRTGRAGLSGRSFMLAAPEDGKAVAEIVKLIGKEIPMGEIEGIAAAELDYSARRGRGSRPTARIARPDRPQRAGGDRSSAHPAPIAERERPARRKPRPAAEAATRPNVSALPNPPAKTRNGATVTPFPRAAEPRRPRQPARGLDEDRKIVGFGDDLPAFLARPPRIVARP